MIRIVAAGAALALAAAVHAQGSDELWEVTSQMNMAGMPPGMGSTKQQICRDKDPKKEVTSRPDMQDCKVTDMKQSGNRFTMTMTCPRGTAVIDQTYNAARTEYKGTMKMTSREGDMTMNLSGRKVGSCDAKQARTEQAAAATAMQQQVASAQASAAAGVKQSEDTQIAQCREAVETMDMGKLGIYAQCDRNAELCTTMATHQARVSKACTASKAEYCKRYQTLDGFLKAKGDERAAEICAVSRESTRLTLCTRAAREENLPFLGRFCPVEGKPYAQKHCVGLNFTGAPKTPVTDFCRSYLANRDLEEPKSGTAAQQPAPSQAQKTKDAVTEGVSQGVNKLRGLFGR